ncbi:hypothetical protein J5Y03_10170 [Bacillus sp. RG28]|uniref:Uncharacterized protein n=1 Tax=Gottfriedia endophytica TaxID=2820819 RepID=A0A940SKS1_9BACI|nr:hypothetical protein [Gottfriedia endophytica]MBP0725553.1 hypothetical protein [Gottfriedia endophytica]
MTDKERLDEIISKHTDLDKDLSIEDKTWVIQEASKVELLEEVNSGLDGDYQFYKIECDKLGKKAEQLEEKVNRYGRDIDNLLKENQRLEAFVEKLHAVHFTELQREKAMVERYEKILKEIVSYSKYEGNQWYEKVKKVLMD